MCTVNSALATGVLYRSTPFEVENNSYYSITLDRVTDEFDNQVTVQVGVFEPRGINQICNNDIPEELNGVPFNRLGPRIQYMVSL